MPRIAAGVSGLRASTYTVDEIVQAVEGGLGAQEALAISIVIENEDFTHTEALEAETQGGLMDDEDAVVANWSPEEVKRVRVIATAVVDEGSSLGAIGVTENDEIDLQFWINEVVALVSEEGPSDVNEGATTFTLDDVVNVRGGDILRLVLEVDAAATSADYDVAAAGELDLVPVD